LHCLGQHRPTTSSGGSSPSTCSATQQ
jgi:hypothetical protein